MSCASTGASSWSASPAAPGFEVEEPHHLPTMPDDDRHPDRPHRMIDQLVHLLGYEFAQNALAAGLVVGIVSGVVSRFVVMRNMAFAVHALSELGFTGSAGAILVGTSPVLGLMVGTTITALFIGALGVRVRERDSVVGIAMAFGLGLGVLFLSLYPRFATQAFAILFGSITGVSRGDVALLIGIGVVTLVTLARDLPAAHVRDGRPRGR